MSKRTKRLFAEISKTEKLDDGTLKVYGYASSGAEDSDGEIITPDAMKAALPDYLKFGAVREMHQPKAAGTAIEATVEADGKTWFGAHIVDSEAVKKVEAGVYKGFSIGGKVTERDPEDKSVIKGLKLVEISLVDRPANPEALITMFKAERTDEDDVEDLAELLDNGTVTPAKLLELAKAAKAAPAEATPSAAPAAAPAPVAVVGGESIKKGLWSVSDFAAMLQSVGWMVMDAASEAAYEGDNSPLPAQLKAWFSQGAAILQAMTAEELSELSACLDQCVAESSPEPEKVMKAMRLPKAFSLVKSGATFSAKTKAALADIHEGMKQCVAKMADLGYDSDAEADKSAAPTDITKGDTTGIVHELIEKALTPLREDLNKAKKENADLLAEVNELKKRAAPGKALLRAVAVNKSMDAAPVDEANEQAANVPPEGTPARAAYEMRKALGSGGVPLQRLA